MAEMILPLVALAGFAQAAPQAAGLGLGGSGSLGAGAGVGALLGGSAATARASASAKASASASASAKAAGPLAGVPVVGGAIGGVAGTAASLPVVGNVAGAASNLPAVSGAVGAATGVVAGAIPGLTLPAILDTLPTGSVLQIAVPTTVPLESTALIASLAGLPQNAAVTGIVSSILGGDVAIPTDVLDNIPVDIPTGVGAIGGLPAITAAPEIKNLVSGLQGDLLGDVAGTLQAVISQLASAAGGAGGAIGVPTGVPANILGALTALPTGAGLAAVAQATAAVGGKVNVSSILPGREKADAKKSEDSEDAKEKRQLDGLTGLLGGSGGGPLGAVTGLLGGSGGPLNAVTGLLGGGLPLGLLTGALGGAGSPLTGALGLLGGLSSVTGLLGSLTGPSGPLSTLTGLLGGLGGLAGVTGGLSGLPGLGGLTSGLPIGSVLGSGGSLLGAGRSVASGSSSHGLGLGSLVLNTIKSIPLPELGLGPLVEGIKSAALAPLTDILEGTPFLGQITRSLGLLNTLAVLNIGKFASLATLTDLPAVQSAVLLLNTPDLATVTHVLSDTGIVPSIALDSLLANPADLLSVVSALQPLVSNLPAAVSFVILSQLGATGIQNVVPGIDTSAVTSILSQLPAVGSVTGALPVGNLSGALPVRRVKA